jgi:AcrR family transcriptional regulator
MTDTETTYQRILNAATAEIKTYGSDRATVVSIARTAAMTHANVYRHFESKTALFDAITQTWLKPIEAKLSEIADAPDPARDKLERFIFAVVQAYRKRIEVDPRLFAVFVEAFRANRTLARQHRAKIRTLLDRVLEEGVHSGAFTIRNRERAMALIFDTLYRFIQPEAIELDIEIQRRSWENRLGLVTTMLLNTLSNLTV